MTPAAAAGGDETVRLALAIADEEARCHIECNCRAERIGGAVWWDTLADEGPGDDAPAECDDIAITTPNCMRYLELRDLIVRHSTQPHLVRFVERIALPAAQPART